MTPFGIFWEYYQDCSLYDADLVQIRVNFTWNDTQPTNEQSWVTQRKRGFRWFDEYTKLYQALEVGSTSGQECGETRLEIMIAFANFLFHPYILFDDHCVTNWNTHLSTQNATDQ